MSAHNSSVEPLRNSQRKMMLTPALVLAAVAHSAAFTPSDGLVTPSSYRRAIFSSSALHYSNSEDDGGESYYSPLPIPRPLHRRGRQDRLPHHRQGQGVMSSPMSKMNSTRSADGRPSRHIPRRAMPHVKHASNEEAATRAGYIIRESQMSTTTREISSREMRPPQVAPEPQQRRSGDQDHQQMANGGGVRPLRTIRRIVHRSRDDQQQRADQNPISIEGPNNPLDLHVRSRRRVESARFSLANNKPQLEEFLDKPEKLPAASDVKQRKGASRVTFKATRESSSAILSKPIASLTEYMTQPVSQYSLLSFHDADDCKNDNAKHSNSRRWLVRRLSNEEAQPYICRSAASSLSAEEKDVMDESNLFRLAVPLLPLIGWDLTPVIDLEVIPPKLDTQLSYEAEIKSLGDSNDPVLVAPAESEWAPLKGIRKRINSEDISRETSDTSPVVKIRSLRVSLLSTQEEVKEVMSNQNNKLSRQDSNMQKEAIEMVSKVEDWLRPHITFEAELSWTDSIPNASGTTKGSGDSSLSTVSVRSTAITSLTIPKIPSDIIRRTVPSAFLVKQLGATLTSQALAICLPRFLRQLEKDYNRWCQD